MTGPAYRQFASAPFLLLLDRFGTSILALWLVFRGWTVWGVWQTDMSGLYLAARAYGIGQWDEVYASPETFFGDTPPAWQDDVAAVGAAGETAFAFVYPPIWAALLSPVTRFMSPHAFMNGSLALQLALLFLSIRLCWRLAGAFVPWPRWAALSVPVVALSAPTDSAIVLNQVQISLSFLILGGLLSLQRRHDLFAGFLFGLVAAVKLTPLTLMIIFVVSRRWRAAVAAACTFVAFATANLLLIPVELNTAFHAALTRAGGFLVSARTTFNLPAILYELGGNPDGSAREIGLGGHVAPVPTWVSLWSYGTLICAVALVLLLARRLEERRQMLVLLVGLTVATAFAGPIGWSHYYLIPTLVLPALTAAGRMGWILFLMLIATTSTVFVFTAPLLAAMAVPALAFVGLTVVLARPPFADQDASGMQSKFI